MCVRARVANKARVCTFSSDLMCVCLLQYFVFANSTAAARDHRASYLVIIAEPAAAAQRVEAVSAAVREAAVRLCEIFFA